MQEIKRYDAYNGKVYTKDEYVQDCLGGLPNVGMLEEQFAALPIVQIGYDSKADTLEHIRKVGNYLNLAAMELQRRAIIHDESKLKSPEKEMFDEWTPKLANSTYGSDEYKEFLKNLKPALDHHYKHNSHHPEYYYTGVDGMDLFDLIEMFLDWKAAGERHKDGDIFKSIEINKARFGLSDQLVSIFNNTAKRLTTLFV